MPSEDNRRIAKNTLFLYLRMFLTIVVNLYAARVIWQVLGIDDYGVYNVVGGIVTMFAFLNNAMVASSQRFISFELGKGNGERLRKVFCISVTVHILLAIGILFLAETVGLWFLNEKLNIPAGRMAAANWVYQCSVVAFMINVVSVPYNACIVAHEHMKAYGYFGILEVFMKLAIVFLLLLVSFDKLIVYAILVVCVSALMRLIYGVYCGRNFAECRYKFVSDHQLMKDMFSFAGWSFIGNLGFSVRDQGLNIVVNLFFNVAVNAAKGIATQIGAVVSGFSQNFQMALNPQITKAYAAGNIDNMMQLVYSGCKYSVFLMMLIVIPLVLASNHILQLWLGEVAPYTTGFVQLVLIVALIDSVVSPITTSLQATGHIKKFQLFISVVMFANLPMAWIWLKFVSNPYIVFYVCIMTSFIAVIGRLMLLREQIEFSYLTFIRKVVIRCFPPLIVSSFLSWLIYGAMSDSFLYLIVFGLCSCSISALAIFILGLEKSERQVAISYVRNKLKLK